ncbi:serine/threonine-protein kinase HAL4/sat4 [Coelomomyces lativittatus]|nr:serine/threonine-protein kinase HAL4/sat4 [Coelomomyces lativittatus]
MKNTTSPPPSSSSILTALPLKTQTTQPLSNSLPSPSTSLSPTTPVPTTTTPSSLSSSSFSSTSNTTSTERYPPNLDPTHDQTYTSTISSFLTHSSTPVTLKKQHYSLLLQSNTNLMKSEKNKNHEKEKEKEKEKFSLKNNAKNEIFIPKNLASNANHVHYFPPNFSSFTNTNAPQTSKSATTICTTLSHPSILSTPTETSSLLNSKQGTTFSSNNASSSIQNPNHLPTSPQRNLVSLMDIRRSDSNATDIFVVSTQRPHPFRRYSLTASSSLYSKNSLPRSFSPAPFSAPPIEDAKNNPYYTTSHPSHLTTTTTSSESKGEAECQNQTTLPLSNSALTNELPAKPSSSPSSTTSSDGQTTTTRHDPSASTSSNSQLTEKNTLAPTPFLNPEQPVAVPSTSTDKSQSPSPNSSFTANDKDIFFPHPLTKITPPNPLVKSQAMSPADTYFPSAPSIPSLSTFTLDSSSAKLTPPASILNQPAPPTLLLVSPPPPPTTTSSSFPSTMTTPTTVTATTVNATPSSSQSYASYPTSDATPQLTSSGSPSSSLTPPNVMAPLSDMLPSTALSPNQSLVYHFTIAGTPSRPLLQTLPLPQTLSTSAVASSTPSTPTSLSLPSSASASISSQAEPQPQTLVVPCDKPSNLEITTPIHFIHTLDPLSPCNVTSLPSSPQQITPTTLSSASLPSSNSSILKKGSPTPPTHSLKENTDGHKSEKIILKKGTHEKNKIHSPTEVEDETDDDNDEDLTISSLSHHGKKRPSSRPSPPHSSSPTPRRSVDSSYDDQRYLLKSTSHPASILNPSPAASSSISACSSHSHEFHHPSPAPSSGHSPSSSSSSTTSSTVSYTTLLNRLFHHAATLPFHLEPSTHLHPHHPTSSMATFLAGGVHPPLPHSAPSSPNSHMTGATSLRQQQRSSAHTLDRPLSFHHEASMDFSTHKSMTASSSSSSSFSSMSSATSSLSPSTHVVHEQHTTDSIKAHILHFFASWHPHESTGSPSMASSHAHFSPSLASTNTTTHGVGSSHGGGLRKKTGEAHDLPHPPSSMMDSSTMKKKSMGANEQGSMGVAASLLSSISTTHSSSSTTTTSSSSSSSSPYSSSSSSSPTTPTLATYPMNNTGIVSTTTLERSSSESSVHEKYGLTKKLVGQGAHATVHLAHKPLEPKSPNAWSSTASSHHPHHLDRNHLMNSYASATQGYVGSPSLIPPSTNTVNLPPPTPTTTTNKYLKHGDEEIEGFLKKAHGMDGFEDHIEKEEEMSRSKQGYGLGSLGFHNHENTSVRYPTPSTSLSFSPSSHHHHHHHHHHPCFGGTNVSSTSTNFVEHTSKIKFSKDVIKEDEVSIEGKIETKEEGIQNDEKETKEEKEGKDTLLKHDKKFDLKFEKKIEEEQEQEHEIEKEKEKKPKSKDDDLSSMVSKGVPLTTTSQPTPMYIEPPSSQYGGNHGLPSSTTTLSKSTPTSRPTLTPLTTTHTTTPFTYETSNASMASTFTSPSSPPSPTPDLAWYAIKQFRKKKKDETEKEYLKKVSAEFCIASSLHHPNIIETIDLIQTTEGVWSQVMEYMPGGDMFKYLQQCQSKDLLTGVQANCYFRQLLHGVHYLHTVGVVHRDLKPENLLLDSSGRWLKITDFGTSQVFRSPWSTTTSYTSGVCGSDPYMAPELWFQHMYSPEPVDVWSMGVLYFIFRHFTLPWKKAHPQDPHYAFYLACLKEKKRFQYFDTLEPGAAEILRELMQPDPEV